MKNLKLAFAFLVLFTSFGSTFAQSITQIPEKLHGFWAFNLAPSGSWDGTLIGADYVEFFYQLYSVDKIVTTDNNGYQISLKNENGKTLELEVSEINGEQAKLQFSEWKVPKECRLLNYPKDLERLPFADLPPQLFKEWTKGDGKLSFQLHGKNQLFYQYQNWEVLWAGYYLDKQYRMLIKNEDVYKLVYFTNISDKSLRVVCNLKEELNIPLAANRDIYKILGNWGEKSNNKWRLGFFEENAIFDGEVYKYRSFEFKGSKFTLVLENETKETNLKIKLGDSANCKVSINGAKDIELFKCGQHLPAYKTLDKAKFVDTGFKKIDTVTIRGYLRNNPTNKPFSVTFMDPIKDDPVHFYADVDKRGIFTLRFPLLNTTQVNLDWGRMRKMDVVEPGESYFMFYDFATKQYLITGDNNRFHNEFAAYDRCRMNSFSTREQNERIQNLSQLDYLKIKRLDLYGGYAHLEKYIETNPYVSERFKYFYENYYRFNTGFYLMQRFFTLDRQAEEKFPEEFMIFVNDTLCPNTPPKPITLVRDYFTFMRDYINYAQYNDGNSSHSHSHSQSISSIEAFEYMEINGKIELSEDDRNSIKLAKEFYLLTSELRDEKADSVQIAEASKPYLDNQKKISELFRREEVKDFLQNDWNKIVPELFAKRRMESAFSTYDGIISDPILKDIFEAQKFYKYIDKEKIALSFYMIELMEERINHEILIAEVRKLDNYYKQLSKQDILYVESLKNTEHLKDSKDADSLFAALTEPYRGKVIYIDFWGTWCGPCKQQMKYVREAKEALRGKDVIFMYFANNSPEASWKNVIKENHLSGENAVHYRLLPQQQSMLERRLSIRSFPTYILMDKEGGIVNMKAPRPEQKHELVKEISKLLDL